MLKNQHGFRRIFEIAVTLLYVSAVVYVRPPRHCGALWSSARLVPGWCPTPLGEVGGPAADGAVINVANSVGTIPLNMPPLSGEPTAMIKAAALRAGGSSRLLARLIPLISTHRYTCITLHCNHLKNIRTLQNCKFRNFSFKPPANEDFDSVQLLSGIRSTTSDKIFKQEGAVYCTARLARRGALLGRQLNNGC